MTILCVYYMIFEYGIIPATRNCMHALYVLVSLFKVPKSLVHQFCMRNLSGKCEGSLSNFSQNCMFGLNSMTLGVTQE